MENKALSDQQMYQKEFFDTLEEMYLMLEDEETLVWYENAKIALRFASPLSLNLPIDRYLKILEVVDNGINYNNVAYMCNNYELRTPNEMNMTLEDFIKSMQINYNMSRYWNGVVSPIMNKLKSKYGIGQQPRILSINGKRN